MKNCAFLVVLSDFGRVWAFSGEPAEISCHLGGTFGVQTWEENRRRPLIGDARGHLRAVFVSTRHSRWQKQPFDDLLRHLGGVVFCFIPRLALQRGPQEAMIFQRVRPKMHKIAQNRSKPKKRGGLFVVVFFFL